VLLDVDAAGGLSIVVGHPATGELVGAVGSVAWFRESSSTLRPVGFSDPLEPRPMPPLAVPESCDELAVTGKWLTLACDETGARTLLGYDARDPSAVTSVGSWSQPSFQVFDAAATSAAAYVTTSLGKTAILNVDSRGLPLSVTGWLATDHRYLSLSGDRLVAWDKCSFEIYDLAANGAPIQRGEITRAACNWSEVAAAGNVVLVGLTEGGLLVFDATDPVAPHEVASLALGGSVKRIRPVGKEAFVLTTSGVALVDLADPHSPALLGSYPMAASAMAARGRTAFVYRGSSYRGSLAMVSFQDPAAPSVLANGPERYVDTALDIALLGSEILVALPDYSVDVYEATEETGIRQTAALLVEGNAARLAPSGNVLLAAAGAAGLLALDRQPGD
jgi:hypothetical protein